jgi:hypothetical protein
MVKTLTLLFPHELAVDKRLSSRQGCGQSGLQVLVSNMRSLVS